MARGRGLLDKFLAYDLVFRASKHPAADHREQAQGGVLIDPVAPEPLPKFPTEALGDCIDCTICVQVCPTGIDIRNGLQYECIACGACVDACDSVMDKMGFARGLIRYTTQNAIDGQPTRVMRPRIFIYGGLLLALLVAFAWGVGTRSPLIAEALRDRNALYRETQDGIENNYTLKLVNKTDRAQRYVVSLQSTTPGLALRGPSTIDVAAGDVAAMPVVVSGPADIRGRHALRFDVRSSDGSVGKTVDSNFFGPM
jgi:cytochrome c oxidase accessory protein FixG